MKRFLQLFVVGLFVTQTGMAAPSKSPTNTLQKEQIERIDMYPNPSFGHFYVVIEGEIAAQISLFDATGSPVSGYFIEERENGVYFVDVKDMFEGVYLVHVKTATQAKTMRMFVK